MCVRLFIKVLFVFISPVLGVFLTEIFTRGEIGLAYTWVIENPGVYFFAIIIFYIIQSLVIALTNNIYLSIFATYLLFFILLLINKYKQLMLNEPLLPWDLFFADQIVDLLPALYKSINILNVFLGIVFTFLIIFLICKYTEFNLIGWKRRIILFFISTTILALVANYPSNIFDKYLKDSGANYIASEQNVNQKTNGFIVGFILNLPSVLISEPPKYSSENVVNRVSDIQLNDYEVSNTKPNIVVVMSESFWELGKLNLNYNSNSLHPTVDEYKIGSLISPTFGGGTANVEFEVLTGFSSANLPGGSIPYQQYITKETQSLAKVLTEQGYNTTAIHTYNKNFWNRNDVYKYLGFEKFIGLEDLKNPKYNGLFVDDEEVNNLLLEELKTNDKATFIFAVTMQNHGAYLDTRYEEKTLNIADKYSKDSNQMINTYGTGILHSDNTLKSLMKDISELNEPTLVVFFGDHLPNLGNVYVELGYLKNMENKTLSEELKMKQTPLVVWNNYSKFIQPVNNISASFLAPKIMEWAELKSPVYYDFLSDFYNKLPVYTASVNLDRDGLLLKEAAAQHNDIVETYQMIQYDIMFGKRYSQNSLFND